MEYRQPLSRIYLYDEPDAPGLDVEAIGGFLVSTFPRAEVIPRTDFFTHQFGRFSPEERSLLEQETLRQLGAARVHDLASHSDPLEPEAIPAEELDLEFVFDAALYQAILRLLIDPRESAADHLHIVFTESGIGTWPGDGRDFKLHILCMGAPSILSVPGLVEALPHPREYDFKRAQLAMFGLQEDALDDLAAEFADRSFGYGDPRINEICKGYALMACVYRLTGEAFCADPACRLHAAQTQEELIELQCGEEVGLCERHQDILDQVAVD